MRIIFISLFCVLFARVLPAQLPGDPGFGNSDSPDALVKAIVVYEYTFDHVDLKETIKFNADGTGKSNRWAFQWRARNGHEVELWQVNKPNVKTSFRFNADYSSYQGEDFSHVKHVTGHQIKTAAAQPTPPPQAQQPPQPAGGGTSGFGTNGQGAATPVISIDPEVQKSASALVAAYRNSLVFVTGKEGSGSGFIATIGGANFLITNAHVAAGINGAAFKSLDGTVVQGGSASAAVGADIFRMVMPAGGKPLEIMQGVDGNAAIGDDVVVLGNAEGAGVINTITGKIVGIGPNLVEVDAPFVPGNSGSPIIHLKTGKVIGVATYTVTRKFDTTTNEKIATPVIRRFGYRLDSVKAWQVVDWRSFYAQAAEMRNIETLTADLSDFFNDLSENKGSVTRGRHTNPVIKNQIDQWIADKSHQLSAADNHMVDASFLSFLKLACQSDVTAARQHMGYDYFQRELADEQQTRDEMSKAFEEIIKGLRD